jgi:DNA polymerase III subunit gamma/tau
MDKFIVSARKYRPQTFDTVVGQSHITTTLKNAIRHNQLAHAFLFCGPRGVGKTTCARILAKTINCENQTKDGEACNKCHSCVSFNEGTSLNIHELDAASNNSVDDIRTLVEQVRFAPQAGKYKVYIIDEVHMLSSAAFNAFLKTLEEPPPYAIFILATTEKHKILPTILSRCQIFDFKRITTNDTVSHLREICDKEEVKADKAALHLIAQKSEGCMRDALSIMDKIVSFTSGELTYANTLEHLNILDEDYYFRLLDSMLKQDLAGAMLLYDDINRKGFEGDLVLNGFAEFIRNLLVCKDEKAASLLDVVESFKDKYIETSRNVSAAVLISTLNILNEAEINYKAARNKRLHVELVLIKLCYLQQAIELSSDPGAGIGKKKVVESAKPLAFRQITPIAIGQSDGQPSTADSILAAARARLSPTEEQGLAKSKLQPATGSYRESEAMLVVEEEPIAFNNGQGTAQLSGRSPSATITKQTLREQTAGSTTNNKLQTTNKKLSALDKIRSQYQANGDASADLIAPLQEEELQLAWNRYGQKLREARNPAVQSFELASLQIKDANSFEVITSNNIEQKFIEQERNHLFSFLKEELKNRMLQFTVIISESTDHQQTIDLPLTSKEQFLKMSEQYPLVKELKDRLKLELDY